MNTTNTMSAGKTKLESVALRRARQERLRQLSVRPTTAWCTPEAYEPRHRADVRVDSVA